MGRTNADLDLLGGGFTDHEAVGLFEVIGDALGDFITGNPDRFALHGRAEAQDGDIGGATADVDNHAADGLGNRQASTDRGGHGFIDQVDLFGADDAGFTDRPALHIGDAARDADHHPRSGGLAGIAAAHEGLDHELGGGVISNDAIAQGTNRLNRFRGFADHAFCAFSHLQWDASL